jgi:hypothetical protein
MVGPPQWLVHTRGMILELVSEAHVGLIRCRGSLWPESSFDPCVKVCRFIHREPTRISKWWPPTHDRELSRTDGIPHTRLMWSAACLRRKKRAPDDALDIVASDSLSD